MQRVFSDADRAIRYAADVEAYGLRAAIERVVDGQRSFFVVRLAPRAEAATAGPAPTADARIAQ